MDKEPHQEKVVLGIHSYGGDGGLTDGHAWISVQRGDKAVEYYGLWPDDHPAVKDNGSETDIRNGMERRSPSDADRYYSLSPKQVTELDKALGENVTWHLNNNCSSWASETVSRVTGKQIDASTWLPTVETPNALKETIMALEAKNPTSADKPLDPIPKNQSSSSSASNDQDNAVDGQNAHKGAKQAVITEHGHPGNPLFNGLRNALPDSVPDDRVALAAVRTYENGMKDMSQVGRVGEFDGNVHVAGTTPGYRASVLATEAIPPLASSSQQFTQQVAAAQTQEVASPSRGQAMA
jgi:hypothetical protein